jgi:hypothetical protein
MRNHLMYALLGFCLLTGCNNKASTYIGFNDDLLAVKKDSVLLSDTIVYHTVRVDQNWTYPSLVFSRRR